MPQGWVSLQLQEGEIEAGAPRQRGTSKAQPHCKH
jgi:hypothetical protein